MKTKTILFVLALALFGSQFVFAQYEKDLVILDYTNSYGEEGISTYIYNSREQPYKTIWELKDGSRWSVNFNEFDKNGNMIKKHRDFSDSITIDQAFFYNENNQLIQETFSRSDGRKGIVNYFYEDNLLKYADCKGLNGWFTGFIEYLYDDHNKKIKASLKDNNQIIGEISYAYNSNDQLWIEKWTFNQGFTQTFTYYYLDKKSINYKSSNVFLQSDCGRKVKKEIYNYSGKSGGPSYYEYEEGNKLALKTFERSDGLKTVTSFSYKPNGLLLSSERKYANGNTGWFSYTYNKYRQLINREYSCSDGMTSSEEYHYNDDGKLISARYSNFDGWLSGDLIFRHDRYDRVQSAIFQGNNKINAKISFTYDKQGCLTRIHWDLSNGITQTYEFEY